MEFGRINAELGRDLVSSTSVQSLFPLLTYSGHQLPFADRDTQAITGPAVDLVSDAVAVNGQRCMERLVPPVLLSTVFKPANAIRSEEVYPGSGVVRFSRREYV